MPRQEFSQKIRAQAFQRCNGRCENCGVKLTPGNIEYDHELPDGLGGKATLQNCRVLCRNCHGGKTHKQDRPRMAKADRIRKKSYGVKKSKWPKSRFKKKVSGEVVLRD